MKVRGRQWEWAKGYVESAMKGETPDNIQKHAVEINGTVYPPKQVIEHVSGWPRLSFTTADAQRVLTKIGFECGDMESIGNNRRMMVPASFNDGPSEDRVAALEAAVATAQEAIAGLGARVRTLESAAR